ncbi:biotin carboxylase [Glutamicibacter soli]
MANVLEASSHITRPRIPKPSELSKLRHQVQATEGLNANVATDAAYNDEPHPEAAPQVLPFGRQLKNMSEVRHFFRTNQTPIYFIGATPVNLLGLDRWVRKFSYITYYDGWDGQHPRVFTPGEKPYVEFDSAEEINNWPLENSEVREFIDSQRTVGGPKPKVAMVFFNEETESICEELGYDLILPRLRCAPNLIEKSSLPAGQHRRSSLGAQCAGHRFQLPRADNLGAQGQARKRPGGANPLRRFGQDNIFHRQRRELEPVFEVHSRRRPQGHEAHQQPAGGRRGGPDPLRYRGGTDPHRTGRLQGAHSYRGGWCGNEMHPDILTDSQRARAIELVRNVGSGLQNTGYRGFFEVDVLVDTDTDTDDVYLGELNPRISGASAITNVTAGAYADVPLFLFHLLEYLDVDFKLDVDEINDRWQEMSGADVWSHMIIKETDDILQYLTHAPRTGNDYLDPRGKLQFSRSALDWHQLQNHKEAFFLRIYGEHDYRWKGADLGVLVTKAKLQYEGKRKPNSPSMPSISFPPSAPSTRASTFPQ